MKTHAQSPERMPTTASSTAGPAPGTGGPQGPPADNQPRSPMEVADLPFNRLIGITPAKEAGWVLSLPADVRYTNHLGTVHASALLALAEATSGVYLVREFWDIGFEVLPVVRRVEAKFRKPAWGAVSSRMSVSPETKAEFVAALRTKGRALLQVHVDVHDEKGSHALAADVEWFVVRKA